MARLLSPIKGPVDFLGRTTSFACFHLLPFPGMPAKKAIYTLFVGCSMRRGRLRYAQSPHDAPAVGSPMHAPSGECPATQYPSSLHHIFLLGNCGLATLRHCTWGHLILLVCCTMALSYI